MRRYALTDEQWARLVAVIPKQQRGPSAKIGDRQFVDAVLFRAKTGLPWRDLPDRFGPWKSVYNRFNNWSKRGYWKLIFKALQVVSTNPDLSLMAVTSALTKMPQVERAEFNCLGRSRGGFSTKIHAITDGQGRPLHVTLVNPASATK